jgi:hypothetical protein
MLATLSRWRSSVQIRSGTPFRSIQTARYANWQSGEAQTFADCGFDSHPCYLHASVGHWQASVAVTHPLSSFAGSTPARRTDILARSFRGRTPGSRPGEAGSIPARVADYTTKWWNGRHATLRTSCPHGLVVQISPWLLTRVGQRPAEPHKLRTPGATPGPATRLAGHANWQSDEVESLVILWVRRPPRSLTI